jgi:putative membrane protein
MRTSILAILMASALAVPALAQGMSSSSTMASGTAPVSDSTFVKKAAISDMYEIQAGQLAQTKATSADVKTFAAKMVTDHTKTSDQLKSIIASKSGMKPPAAMDAMHKALFTKLKSASGANFDSAYAQQQIQAHQQAVMLFTSESQNGTDPDLKKFATDTLPALQQHLSMAQQLPKGGAKP